MHAHPIQPLIDAPDDLVRFQGNAIVRFLLDKGGLTLMDIAAEDFSREDHEQFAQLIGYSHRGASELSYMSTEVLDAAWAAYENPEQSAAAREGVLRDQLNGLRLALREPIAQLYGKHPDDLCDAAPSPAPTA